MSHRRDTFNICGFVGRARIMKETITATDRRQAHAVAREVLRRRGFDPQKVRVEIVPIEGPLARYF